MNETNNRSIFNIINLINLMRQLWEQHIMWTRSFIISSVDNLKDIEPVTNRLLRNPVDFANALRRYYGAEKAKMFEALLTDHLVIASKIVNAAVMGNNTEVAVQKNLWYQNADEIAAFFASINPYWNKKEWQQMLYQHLQLTELELVARLNKDYERNVMIYDQIETQALKMADMMSKGIVRQFKL